ncbi:hypothetical protein NF867_07145 [Solitalea sp. MAHUQ-68]|uniref:Uncharacterized protein n=1 Tax=Solitalea agri TaxID=2953739 RepID=A0A9X2JEQ2_9SPHI|nr:hypothetical protein [Solitalea agri]MCO4292631.1 hypothetical protein [Solitalea agri]
MKLNFLFILLILLYCTKKQTEDKNKPITITKTSTTKKNGSIDTLNPNTEILETFTDSSKIGDKGKCKIELIKHRVFDNTYVIVKFYTKGPKYWYIQNTYLYECDALMGLAPNISDFNNDKLNDITFISATAARGSNEVRRLFIYDDYEKKLISIVNSQDYPNMLYNKELDCLDAFMIHGGSSTVFARIKGDSLKEFASVHNDNYRTVHEIDKFGIERLLRKDTIINPENIYIRYINYKPLKEYKE